jgi:hypothetical protein
LESPFQNPGDSFPYPPARNIDLFFIQQFAEAFPEEPIVAIIPLDDDLKRDFYAEMCRIEQWSARTLRQKISSMLFERTTLFRKPVELAKQELIKLRISQSGGNLPFFGLQLH